MKFAPVTICNHRCTMKEKICSAGDLITGLRSSDAFLKNKIHWRIYQLSSSVGSKYKTFLPRLASTSKFRVASTHIQQLDTLIWKEFTAKLFGRVSEPNQASLKHCSLTYYAAAVLPWLRGNCNPCFKNLLWY